MLVNGIFEDLGILSYRTINTEGINRGSAICFVKELYSQFCNSSNEVSNTQEKNDGAVSGALKHYDLTQDQTNEDNGNTTGVDEANRPGVIILNPGQLLYSYKQGTAMTQTSWSGKPRPSALHPASPPLPENHVPGNVTVQEHLQFVFDKVLANKDLVADDTMIHLVGLWNGGIELVKYLEKNCEDS